MPVHKSMKPLDNVSIIVQDGNEALNCGALFWLLGFFGFFGGRGCLLLNCVDILRHGLCSCGCPGTVYVRQSSIEPLRFTCLLSAGIKVVCHHARRLYRHFHGLFLFRVFK